MSFIRHYFLSLIFKKDSFTKLLDFKTGLYSFFFVITELLVLLVNYFKINDLNLLIKQSIFNLLLLLFKFLFLLILMNIFLGKQKIVKKILYGILLINPFRIIEIFFKYGSFVFRLLDAVIILYSLIYVIYFYSINFEINENKKKYLSLPILISFCSANFFTFMIMVMYNTYIV